MSYDHRQDQDERTLIQGGLGSKRRYDGASTAGMSHAQGQPITVMVKDALTAMTQRLNASVHRVCLIADSFNGQQVAESSNSSKPIGPPETLERASMMMTDMIEELERQIARLYI